MFLYYCLKCKKNTESRNSKVEMAKNWIIMPLSNSTLYDSKNSKFTKEREASGLLSSLGIKTPLSKIPVVGSLLY